MPYGRPLKGKSRRVSVAIHSPVGLLDIIDNYVEERDSQEKRAYTRSDFFGEAALLYLRQLGLNPDSEEVLLDRAESVPKKGEAEDDGDNTDNNDSQKGGKGPI